MTSLSNVVTDVPRVHSNGIVANLLFAVMFTLGMLGYIPGLPYWLYNISTFITLPVLFACLLLAKGAIFTKNEVWFIVLFVFTILCSYALSPYGVTIPGFLRAVVPVLFYYLVRTLKIRKTSFYFGVVKVLLIVSFFVALYQSLFQPIYVIENGSWVVYVEEALPLAKRPVSFLGNANVFGVFTVFCYILLFFENPDYLSKKEKVILFLFVLANLVLFSKSRTSMLAFVMVNVVYSVIKKQHFKLLIFLAVSVLLGLFVYSNYEDLLVLDDLFRLSALVDQEDNSYTIRRRIAEFTFDLISQRPLFGVGTGNEMFLMADTGAPHKGSESASLLLLIERGIVGYLFYLYILFAKLLSVRSAAPKILIGLTIISVDFTETVCVIPQLTVFLAIYFGISQNESNYNKQLI